MARILDAFEKLLRNGSYESITINDIAIESATGAGSIYARFDGKRSILLALHARTRDRARRYFQILFDPNRKSDESLDVAIERITRGMFIWHKRRRSVIRTSVLLDDADLYLGISVSFGTWTEQLARLLIARGAALSDAQALDAAAAILQLSTAVLQQWVIFGRVPPVGRALSDASLISLIRIAALAQVRCVSISH
ncbi:TetR/AcrR family transcriptional regulator [Sphingomonas sp.]|uniref:TetR/AcrR family transcriptional regulator n=1 Tax=Sphingomonas sp. TaxID=28214 RepID=UPI0025DDD72A|nr:TetR/AcrR family transcriptional regulator [Sphingomonas sp.]